MISRYSVALNGVEMSSLDDNLLILDVAYPKPNYNVKQRAIADLDGYDISDIYLERQEVEISFELHIYDIAERNAVCQAVNEWADAGGRLVVNDREGQFLQVRCSKYASIESVRNWTDPLTITFTTVAVPYWQDEELSQKTLSGKSSRGTLHVSGNKGNALVSVNITANASVSTISVECGSTKIVLKGLSVASGKKVVIDYVNNRFIRIKADGSSVLSKLQPESTDNLKAKCGANNSIKIDANGKVTALFEARGLYL